MVLAGVFVRPKVIRYHAEGCLVDIGSLVAVLEWATGRWGA